MRRFPFHTALAIGMFTAALCFAPRAIHGLAAPSLTWPAAIVDFTPEHTPLSPFVRHTALEMLSPVPPNRPKAVVAALLDDSHDTLEHFYASLWRTERGEAGAITHILHYGDSPTTADLITGDTRRLLQNRFGNAGHGFTLIGKPWAWYEHRDIGLTSSGWQMDPGTRFDLRNSSFGLGGVIFTAQEGAYSRIKLRDHTQTELEIWYQRQPGGGDLAISADGESVGSVPTAAPVRSAGFARFELQDGAETLELRPRGDVRLFGITIEKDRPGIVYDSVGLNGASISVLAVIFNERSWAEELRHRHPDLVVINYGTNEAGYAAFIGRQYEKQLREAIRRVHAALPDTSILVMSPMDRGQRMVGGEILTMPTIPQIVSIQRRVAAELNCAFFNTFEAMGGEGTMASWYEKLPRLVSADFIHPTPAGARYIAGIYVKELNAGFNRYKLRQLLHHNAVAEVR